jgi:hypothetical protein
MGNYPDLTYTFGQKFAQIPPDLHIHQPKTSKFSLDREIYILVGFQGSSSTSTLSDFTSVAFFRRGFQSMLPIASFTDAIAAETQRSIKGG